MFGWWPSQRTNRWLLGPFQVEAPRLVKNPLYWVQRLYNPKGWSVQELQLDAFGYYSQLFSALNEPTRLRMLLEIAQADRWPCVKLEERLAVSKSTISYHVRILHQAGLIDVEKSGRNYFYTLRWEVFNEEVPALLPSLRGVDD